nr:MAG TPA: tail collar fiber protein [Caudoviricetes sp.]
MAEFKKIVITKKGQALMAKMIAGQGNIDFTKVAASETAYTDAQLEGLTSLSGVKQTTLVSKVTRTNGVAIQVEAAMTNTDLKTGYYMKTLGLYAIDPDEGEILYGVSNATVPGWMPPYNGLTVSGAFFKLVTTVGNAENVSLNVDPGAVATIGDIQDLQEQIADLQAYVGYTDGDIYGVEADFINKKFTRLAGAVNRTPGAGFDGINAFGGRRRCNLADDGTVVAYYGEAGYSETGKLTQAVVVGEGDTARTFNAGTIVQVMVEQPKFYYKVVPLDLEPVEGGKGFHMRKGRWYVSDTKKNGFKLHPAFISNGVEKNFIYIAAYEGSLWDASAAQYILNDAQVADFAADMLSSIANAKPISGLTQNLTRGNTRKLAQKRGAGWQQGYGQTAAVTQLLFLVEYASFNMQDKIGAGATKKTDDGATSMTEITGATSNLGNATGSVNNPNGVNIVTYRGEENFYGNIWWFIDGMNINAKGIHELYVTDHDFADDKIVDNYKNAGITLAKTSGYVSAFGYNEEYDWLFVTSETKGNSSLPVGDYFWQNNTYNGIMIALLGARWDGGGNAGGFYWYVNSVSGYRYRSIGGRLVYVPQN